MLVQQQPSQKEKTSSSLANMTTMTTMMLLGNNNTNNKDYTPMKCNWKHHDSTHSTETDATEELSLCGDNEMLEGDFSEHCYKQQQLPDHEQASEEDTEEEKLPTGSSRSSTSNRKPTRRQLSSGSADWHDSFALDDDDDEDIKPLDAIKDSISDLWRTVVRTGGSDQEEEDEDDDDLPEWAKPYDPSEELEELQYTTQDIKSVVMDEEAFRTLQRSLRQRQCCTNLYLAQTVHCYVKHVKEVRERNNERARQQRSSCSF